MEHPYFSDVQFKDMYEEPGPLVLSLGNEGDDTSYFDYFFGSEESIPLFENNNGNSRQRSSLKSERANALDGSHSVESIDFNLGSFSFNNIW
jgi:hypothetical protein